MAGLTFTVFVTGRFGSGNQFAAELNPTSNAETIRTKVRRRVFDTTATTKKKIL